MGRSRIGPYIEYLGPRSPEGFARQAGEGVVRREGVLGMLKAIEDALHGPVRDFDHSVRGLLHEIDGEVTDLVTEGRLSADEIFDEAPIYREFRYYAEHHMRWMPSYPMRILLDAKITSRGNLAVTFSPMCLGPSGEWVHAPEWIDIPFLGSAEIMQRPNDEVLFVRGAERLFARRHHTRFPWDDPFSVACRATNFAFWLVVERLSRRFEVHLARYVALVASDGRDPECVGLEMVDALREHRERIMASVDTFELSTGHAPQVFWAVCRDKGVHGGASKALRGRSDPSSGLTPSVVEHYHSLLSTARDYGLWRPEDEKAASPPGRVRVPERLWPPKLDLMMRSLGHGDPELPDDTAPSAARPTAKRRTTQSEGGNVAGTRAATEGVDGQPNRPPEPHPKPMRPDYAGLRRHPAKPEELEGTGAEDVDGLVRIVNDLIAASGSSAFVTQGDFPSNRANFQKLLARFRRMSPA